MDKLFQSLRFAWGIRRGCLLPFLCVFAAKLHADELNWSKEQQFWSFKAPERHCTPPVQNAAWPTQPLDYFILAKL